MPGYGTGEGRGGMLVGGSCYDSLGDFGDFSFALTSTVAGRYRRWGGTRLSPGRRESPEGFVRVLRLDFLPRG